MSAAAAAAAPTRGSSWLELWVPITAVAHALAATCLLYALSVANPQWKAALGRALACVRVWKSKAPSDASPGDQKAAAAIHAAHALAPAPAADDQDATHVTAHAAAGLNHAPVTSASTIPSTKHMPAWSTQPGPTLTPASNKAPAVTLAVSRVALAWHSVSCSYPGAGPGGGPKVVLRGGVGHVLEGSLCALMGPSGGGKSTLLEILAGRKAVGRIGGCVGLGVPRAARHQKWSNWLKKAGCGLGGCVGPMRSSDSDTQASGSSNGWEQVGRAPSEWEVNEGKARGVGTGAGEGAGLVWYGAGGGVYKKQVGAVSALVPQEDAFPPVLTAVEVLRLWAGLLLGGRGAGAAAARADAVAGGLAAMGLTTQQHTLVGGPLPGGMRLRGLSGGERKRLAVAAGVLGRPALLLLDEPTTGLDAAAASSVVGHLIELLQAGGGVRAVVASLHQPRTAIWGLVDSVVLLANGRTMYAEPRGGLVPWLTHLPPPPCDGAVRGADAGQAVKQAGAQGMGQGPWVGAGGDGRLVSAVAAATASEPARTGADVTGGRAAAAAAQSGAGQCLEGKEVRGAWGAAKEGGAGGYVYVPARHGSPPDWAVDVVNTGFRKPRRYYGRTMETAGDVADAAARFADHYSTHHPHLSPPPLTAEGGCSPAGADLALPTVVALAGGAQPPTTAGTHKPTPTNGHRSSVPGLTHVLPEHQQEQAVQEAAGRQYISEEGKVVGAGEGAGTQQRAGWWAQVRLLAARELRMVGRNPADLAGRCIVFSWSSLFVGAVFYAVAPNIQGLQSRTNVMFAEVVVFYLLPYVYMSLHMADKAALSREVAARLYTPSAYYTAKALVDIPLGLVNAIVFCGTVYGMAGLRHSSSALGKHLLLGALAYQLAWRVLYCAALLAPSQDVAFMAAIGWTALNVLLGNYPLTTEEYTMSWVSPLRYISAMYYTFGGFMAVEFGTGNEGGSGRAFSCAGGLGNRVVSTLPDFLPATTALQSPFVQRMLRAPGADCSIDTGNLLAFFYVRWPWWGYALALLGYLGVVHAACVAALLWASRREAR